LPVLFSYFLSVMRFNHRNLRYLEQTHHGQLNFSNEMPFIVSPVSGVLWYIHIISVCHCGDWIL
jgi:hypothetical protein